MHYKLIYVFNTLNLSLDIKIYNFTSLNSSIINLIKALDKTNENKLTHKKL